MHTSNLSITFLFNQKQNHQENRGERKYAWDGKGRQRAKCISFIVKKKKPIY